MKVINGLIIYVQHTGWVTKNDAVSIILRRVLKRIDFALEMLSESYFFNLPHIYTIISCISFQEDMGKKITRTLSVWQFYVILRFLFVIYLYTCNY